MPAQHNDTIALASGSTRRSRDAPTKRNMRGLQVGTVAVLTIGLSIAGTALPIATGYLATDGATASKATHVSVSLWTVCLTTSVALEPQHNTNTPAPTLGTAQSGDGCVSLEHSTCRSDAFPTAHWTRAMFFLHLFTLVAGVIIGVIDVACKLPNEPIARFPRFSLRILYAALGGLAGLLDVVLLAGILWMWRNMNCLGAGAVLAPGMVITTVSIVGTLCMVVIAFFSRPTLDYEAIRDHIEAQQRQQQQQGAVRPTRYGGRSSQYAADAVSSRQAPPRDVVTLQGDSDLGDVALRAIARGRRRPTDAAATSDDRGADDGSVEMQPATAAGRTVTFAV